MALRKSYWVQSRVGMLIRIFAMNSNSKQGQSARIVEGRVTDVAYKRTLNSIMLTQAQECLLWFL